MLGAASFSTNWLEIAHGLSCFDTTVPLFFKYFWSLAIVEQFYLFWPLLFLLLVRLNRSVWVRVSFPALFALGSAAAMAVGYARITAATEAGAIPNLTRLYCGTDTHLFGLGAGIVLVFLCSDPRGVHQLGY